MTQPEAVECPECGGMYRNLPSHMKIHKGAEADKPAEPGPYDRDTDEKPPKPKKAPAGGWRDKLWGGKPTSPKASRPRAKTKPTPGVRQSAADILGMGWAGIGWGAERFEIDVPVGRCLQFQGPMAGEILDEFLAGGVTDRMVLQRLAGKTDRYKRVSALVTLPLLVGMVERSPEMAAPLEPVIMFALRQNVMAMAVSMKKRQEEDKAYQAVVAELDLPPGPDGAPMDPAQAIWDSMFAPPAGQPPADAEPSSNGSGVDAGTRVA